MKHLLISLVCVALVGTGGCGDPAAKKGQKTTAPTAGTAAKADAPAPTGELKKEDVKIGADFEGDPGNWTLADGDLALVLFRGTLADGTEVDSNKDPQAQPFAFYVGAGSVIKGLDQGVVGMRKGGTRRLTIPPDLAYGDQPAGKIPANSTLVFEIRLLDLVKKGQEGIYDREDVRPGTGEPAKKGDTLTVHYVGTLVNGKQFDSSRERGQPFELTLGAGGVIQAWDFGLVGVRQGGIRKLRVPPALGYGDRGAGPDIGPNQVLLFEIEVLDIKRGG